MTSSTREALLDAASRIIERRRADLPNVAEVSREADLSRPTVYAHFSSSEDLFVGLVDRLRDEVLAIQESADVTTPSATYRSTLVATLDLSVRHVGLLSILTTQSNLDERMADLWHDIHDRPMRRHARFIERLSSAGHASPATSARAIAEAVDGATLRFAQLIAHDPSRRAELAEALIDLQHRLVGLRGTPG